MKRPFFGAWASGTTATVMAKRYRLWPCQNRPREGPENLAQIETRAMGVFGHPESQVGPFPRVGLYARVSTPHQHTIGMQLRQLREFLERRRWQEVLVVEEVVSGSRRRPERDRLLDAARRREIDIIAVWRLDRWGRSLSDLMLTLREPQEARRRLRVAHRGVRLDHVDRPRHGGDGGGLRGVRARDP